MSFAEGLHAESKRRALPRKKKKASAQVVNAEVNDTQKSQVSSPFRNFEILKQARQGPPLKRNPWIDSGLAYDGGVSKGE